MEQTVNTFKGGLQSDTNPMVQGNDSLSDALNATFVTMNGNEIVLQNDMGNRRVDNAYLPAGYEPVGIKEYGGIIYIAAYNPITNRSLIGSFPSPERRISKLNELGNSNISFNFEFNTNNSLEINCLKEDTLLFPLTKDTSLHAGDKFIVYGALDLVDKISNHNNVDESKVVSPKNKQYTLALGILNSENQFVDITSSLVRWSGDSIMDLDNKTDLYKFNAGYFIKLNAPSTNPDLNFTENDALLTEERENAYQIMKANTYSYKLVGPLYLQIRYNHILDFSYNIYGTYDKTTKKAELFVEGFITYNCPDGLTSGKGSDSNYSTYAEGKISNTNFGYDFIINGNKGEFLSNYSSETKYNPETNLYYTKIVKTQVIDGISEDEKIEYTIGVKADLESNHYLYGLSSKGSIDVSKLGSGTVELTGWRFTNNYSNKTGTITYTMDAYPKYNEEFRNFKIKFENVIGGNIVELDAPLNNGKTNLNVTWTEEKISNLLQDRSLYNVTFTYDIYDKTTGIQKGSTVTIDDKEEFYLTTELFNSCYSPNSAEFISDYGYPDGERKISDFIAKKEEDYSSENTFKTKVEKIIGRKLTITPIITTSSKLLETNIEENTEGSLISMSDVDYDIKTTYTKDINITFTTILEANKNLYPSYIEFKDELDSEDFKFTELKSNIDELSEINASEEPKITKNSIVNNKCTTTVTWKDLITITERKVYEGEMKDIFDSFYNYLFQTNYNFLSHSGIVLLSEGVWGADHHGIYVTINLESPIADAWPNKKTNGEIMIIEHSEDLDSYSRWQEAAKKFNLSSYELLDYYGGIEEGKLFAFVALEGNDNSRISQRPPAFGEDIGTIPGYYVREYARLMWKSTTGWAYIDISVPINISSEDVADVNVKKYLTEGDLKNIFLKLYYRRYKTLDSSSSGKTFYIPKHKLEYESYSKNYILKYKIQLEEGKGIELGNITDPLNFSIIDSLKDSEKEINVFTLLPGENFLDLINSELSFNKCILEDSTKFDSEGKELLVGSVYIKDANGKYHKADDSFPVRPYGNELNESYLICVSNKGSLKLQCDFRMDDDEDSITWAVYDLVDKISLDDLNTRINAYQ